MSGRYLFSLTLLVMVGALAGCSDDDTAASDGDIAPLVTLATMPEGDDEGVDERPALDPVLSFETDRAPVSLVIGGRTDAQTPLEYALLMAEAIGGVFVESGHAGHTSVFNDESNCIDDVALAFLLDGTLPEEGVCAERPTVTGDEQ